jgi:hypothetical protein
VLGHGLLPPAVPARQQGQVIEFFRKWYTRASALKLWPHGRVALVSEGWSLIRCDFLKDCGTKGGR